MNLDELRSAQATERRKDSLQHLRDSFYDDVAAYVEDLRAARDRRAEQVAKPFSDDDVRRMSDEVETAEEVAEALYERRVGKVVKLASFAAADMPVDADGMTTEERQLFDDLVDRITDNKSRVLDVLSGEVSADETPRSGEPASVDQEPAPVDQESTVPSPNEQSRPVSDPEPGGDGADALAGAMGDAGDEVADAIAGSADDSTTGAPAEPPSEGEPADPTPSEVDGDGNGDATTDAGRTAVPPDPAPPGTPDATEANSQTGRGSTETETETSARPSESAPIDGDDSDSAVPSDERATVRITRDVGAIFGVDEREYDLASEDVVSLPVENADPLVQRDAAERLD